MNSTLYQQGMSAESNPYLLPTLILMTTVALALGVVVLLVGARIGAQAGEVMLYPNPFAAYETLWPGQHLSNWREFEGRLSEDACSFLSVNGADQFTPHPGNTHHYGECFLSPEEHVFRSVRVVMDAERITSLHLYTVALPESVLLLYWGVPDAIGMSFERNQRTLRWERSSYTAIAYVSSNCSMVTSVSLAGKL